MTNPPKTAEDFNRSLGMGNTRLEQDVADFAVAVKENTAKIYGIERKPGESDEELFLRIEAARRMFIPRKRYK